MAAEPTHDSLKLILESLLFVADEPVEIEVLARICGRKDDEISAAIDAVAADYQGRGLRIQRTGSAVQMVTAPQASSYVEEFLGVDENHRLSHAALETLAIIAYKQPMSRQTLEAIRGVNADRALASLKIRGLITEVGRAASAGRPYLYGTTFRFLEYFGLEKPEDLPPLPEIEQMVESAAESESGSVEGDPLDSAEEEKEE